MQQIDQSKTEKKKGWIPSQLRTHHTEKGGGDREQQKGQRMQEEVPVHMKGNRKTQKCEEKKKSEGEQFIQMCSSSNKKKTTKNQ